MVYAGNAKQPLKRSLVGNFLAYVRIVLFKLGDQTERNLEGN